MNSKFFFLYVMTGLHFYTGLIDLSFAIDGRGSF